MKNSVFYFVVGSQFLYGEDTLVEIAAVEQKQVGIEDYLLAKHYNRKHGKNAYYGQK